MVTTLKSIVPNMMVDDVDATVDFYEKVLKFNKIMTAPKEGNPLYWAMVGRDEVFLMFQKRESFVEEYSKFSDRSVGGALTFYISVQNIGTFYEQLQKMNKICTKLHSTPYGKMEFAIEDCNGYVLVFAEDAE